MRGPWTRVLENVSDLLVFRDYWGPFLGTPRGKTPRWGRWAPKFGERLGQFGLWGQFGVILRGCLRRHASCWLLGAGSGGKASGNLALLGHLGAMFGGSLALNAIFGWRRGPKAAAVWGGSRGETRVESRGGQYLWGSIWKGTGNADRKRSRTRFALDLETCESPKLETVKQSFVVLFK